MKQLPLATVLSLAFILGACSTHGVMSAPNQGIAPDVAVSLSPELPRETILLVSLEDGSVIKQTIISSADLCFKMNAESSTTCLTQGAPIFDPDSDSIIGYEMIEEHIELIAKSD
ncbi:MAG: hypothetical protein OEM50_01030 [Gammaproteobacteria bacterium]|nr:hypothetical protein [Gammaproteobacteria bacterium]MDH3362237.1 hypothetical protein [Gammaproteobacteria bacterium]MDH3480268.1 hypothetical protein [Gammaproteobacteria bacterium]